MRISITTEGKDKISIREEGQDELCIAEYARTGESNDWAHSRTIVPDAIRPRVYFEARTPQVGLTNRQGWTIAHQDVVDDHIVSVEHVQARQGRRIVEVDLETRLKGSRPALMDFLTAYKGQIRFGDYTDI
jgi:hypothetical protein